jgi:cell division protein FtsB
MNRRRKTPKQGNKYKFYLLISIFTIVSFYIITNDFGLKRLIELKREQAGLEREIYQLTKQQINLNNDISNLKTNIKHIEQIAREKFMMAKPGEKVFKVVQYKQVN